MTDIIVYKELVADGRGRIKKKETEVPAVLAKKNYYDEADIKYFTGREIKVLIDKEDNLFYKLIFLLLYETAARVSEAANVKFGDIEPDTLRIKLLTLKQRRRGQIYRYLKISDRLMSILLQYRLKNGFTDEDYVFSYTFGLKPAVRRITVRGIQALTRKEVVRILGPACKDKAHPHVFRHSRAVHLLDAGMNIMLLKNFLGHSNISNTLIYLKYSNKDMIEAIDKANGANA